VFGLFLSVTAVVLEEASARRFPRVRQLIALVLWSVVEQLGYRQVLAAWRTKALVDAARGHKRGHWGDMRRRGLVRPSRKAHEGHTPA
jgi:hypothetical protein